MQSPIEHLYFTDEERFQTPDGKVAVAVICIIGFAFVGAMFQTPKGKVKVEVVKVRGWPGAVGLGRGQGIYDLRFTIERGQRPEVRKYPSGN